MIRAGIIGIGYWGPNLVRNMMDNDDIQVDWMCDLDAKRLSKLSKRYPTIKTTKDVQDLFGDTKLDLVVIATPVHTHYELGMKTLKADKHLLLTKPMTATEEESLQLIDTAQKHKKILMVDHTYVYHPAVACIKQMVGQKELGDLLYYSSERMNLGLYQPDISVIFDLMPHDLSILNELIPYDPVELSVSAKQAARLPQPDIASLQLNYESNFIASIQASWLSPSKTRKTVLTGRNKMVLYDDVDVVQKIKVFDKGVNALEKVDKEQSYTNYIKYRHGDVHSPALANTEALKIEIDHLVNCIHNNTTPHTDGYQGLRVVRILEHADRLARQKKCWEKLPRNPIEVTPEIKGRSLPIAA